MKISRPKPKQTAPNAKRVFKGKLFDVYQWKQKLYDGSYAVFEKLKRNDTVTVVAITEDNKIIVLWQNQPGFKKPCWSLPGGRIDPGESPAGAAKRELKEETGHVAEKIIYWYGEQPHVKIDGAHYTFIAKGCKKISGLNLDAGEKIKPRLVNFDQFINLLFQENFYNKELTYRFIKEATDWKKCLKNLGTIKRRFGIK